MKKLNAMRKRGFTLIETVLVLAVGLGLIVGGIIFFQQAQASSDLTDKTRVAVGVSSEVRSQFRTAASFGTAGTDITAAVSAASSLPAATYNALQVIAQDQEFDLLFANLNEKVCNRMALPATDLGPNSTKTADCANGNLTVTYAR
ncbi:PulJ/GspJ family protein [Defluviimonas salinarum]|uniref:Type II secretion system GspH family protein n=1 Tax=Defluviimonas salinarum TaxID=2992147 RepID=A0ABT3J4J2_9RHOB|nr:type II secretion system protein [Defluviimonas salinarum]MCW3782576.1 type II secretion system GspH family protein [Defluviimonas salinarum]